MGKTFAPQTTQNNISQETIDLGVGDVQPRLLPLDLLQTSAAQCFARGDARFLQYGLEAGDGYFRAGLARFLSRQYGFEVDPRSIFVTNGASAALDLICTLYTRPGDTILVEEPTYFLALRIFADHGLQPVGVPIDGQGLIVDALEDLLRQVRPAFLYTVPTYQNPSGCTLTAHRRERLVELCRTHRVRVIADEVYHLLNCEGTPPLPLAFHTEDENIFSLGSFSKILAPGLRLGWVQTHPDQVTRLAGCGLLDSGGGMNPFTSALVRGVLDDDRLPDHLAFLRSVYGERFQALGDAVRRHLPEVEFRQPEGGFFGWLRLPDGADASALLDHAAAHQVRFRPGRLFSSRAGLKDGLRVGISFYESAQIIEGIARLGRAWRSFRQT